MSYKKCINCGDVYPEISSFLGICLKCIRTDFDNVLSVIETRHSESRRKFNLPERPPKNPNGLLCKICGNECKIGEGETGYCGLRKKVVHAGQGCKDYYCQTQWKKNLKKMYK